MTGYDTARGYRVEPLDDRDDEDPDWTIDPMFSGVHNDGGPHRKLRHKDIEPTIKTPAELATFDPTESRSAEESAKEETS